MPITDRFELRSEQTSDTAEFFFDERDLNIHVENPFAGDSETGFGYTCSISVPKKHAADLAKFLLSRLAATTGTASSQE